MDVNQVAIPAGTLMGHAMHCGANGHNKDWIGFFTQSGFIHTAWGKPGQRYQEAARSGSLADYNRLLSEKTNKGYITVDSYAQRQGGWASAKIAKNTAQATGVTADTLKSEPTKTGIFREIKPPEESLSWDF